VPKGPGSPCLDWPLRRGRSAPRGGAVAKLHPRIRSALSWIITLAIAVLVATGARAYAVQTFFIPSPSMTPTLQVGDRVLVDKLASTIHRGDIVVFHNVPADAGGPPSLVKLVVGLPGETISSIGNKILINGHVVAEPWLPPLTGDCAQAAADVRPTKIPAGHYFMMGDCRGDSDDSRFWGTVPDANIVGKVNVVVWRHGHPWIHWF